MPNTKTEPVARPTTSPHESDGLLFVLLVLVVLAAVVALTA